jgi:hypothetical protein
MTPEQFDAFCAVARKHGLEEFSIGDAAAKFAPLAGPPVREVKDPPAQRTQLEMLDSPLPPDGDVVDLPPALDETGAEIQGPQARPNVGWATEDPAKE